MDQQQLDIGKTIVNGVAFDPKNYERRASTGLAAMDLNALYASVGRLFDLFEEREINGVLVGGIAMLAYIEGRNTQDIDLIVQRSDLAKIPELEVEDQTPDFARTHLDDLQVDLLFTTNKLFALVADQFTTQKPLVNRQVACATEEGLLLLKLFALPSLYRQGNFARVRLYEGDIASLLAERSEPIGSLLEHLRPSLSESDFAEIEAIVSQIQRQLSEAKDRFRQR
ncbi:MAG: hypothetical protein AAGF31_09370 [Planctomycetota bacterium]